MPDLCWREIFQNLQQNLLTRNIPLILLTATPQSRELLEFQQTREVQAIAKSFDLLNIVLRTESDFNTHLQPDFSPCC
ncbi:MAG: hypothetical protein QNJ72_34795 [Pleurocapsa sp. MO_226.B13]|nr:hypothetical protein [Pleurocapsa sp. MO_226.B13]